MAETDSTPLPDSSDPKQEASSNTATKNEEATQNGEEMEGEEEFKMKNLRRYFAECLTEDGDLLVDSYVLGYDEIYKFLCLLGTVFGWVASDVHQKNNVLRAHRKGEQADKYRTVEGMVRHEEETKLVLVNARHKDCTSGARNLLRLHRALAYINAFLECLPGMEEEEKCCPHSQVQISIKTTYDCI